VLLLGCILLSFGVADALKANGIIAVFFMGYWLGNSEFPAKRATSSFMESVSAIFNITLFIMLGLLAFPHRFSGIWVEALLIVFFVMFVARPLAVYLSTIPFGYSVRERVFLMWGGIKGAVPIVLATYPMASGLDGDGFIFDSIFFAVFLSCVIQGPTLGPLSRLLGLTERKRRGSPHTLEIHSLRSSELDMFELHVGERSPCAGRTISQLGLGADVLISSIVRDGKLIPPKGNTAIIEHDILFVLARPDQISDIEMGINGQFCT
jgi:cell volume regulation protein A